MKQLNEIEIGKQGVYIKVQSDMMEGYERVHKLDELVCRSKNSLNPMVTAGVRWINGKIPKQMMDEMLGTMKAFKDSETGFLLAWSPSKKEYKILLPPQSRSTGCALSMGRVKNIPEGFSIIGTFHTHPHCIRAFWSDTDVDDQTEQTSIHTVFSLGHDGSVQGLKCTLYIVHANTKGEKWYNEYDQDPEDVFESTDFVSGAKPNKVWVEQIKKDHAALYKHDAEITIHTTKHSVDASTLYPVSVSKALDGYRKFGTGFAEPDVKQDVDPRMVSELVDGTVGTLMTYGADPSSVAMDAIDAIMDYLDAGEGEEFLKSLRRYLDDTYPELDDGMDVDEGLYPFGGLKQ